MKQLKGNVLASATLIASAMAFSAAAHAGNYEHEWMENTYVGVDIEKVSIDFKAHNGVRYQRVYHGDLTGINGYVGYQFTPIWSAELGYMETSDKHKTVSTITNDGNNNLITGTTDTELRQWHLDGIGRYELNQDLDLVGSVGLERSKLAVSKSLTTNGATVKGAKSDVSWRIGAGLDYSFTEELDGRVMIRYADTDFQERASSIMYYSVGLAYDF